MSNTDLYDHVEWLKREVAVPGTFAGLFPDTTDDDLAAALVDGLYKAKLDGWLPTVEADPDTFEASAEMSLTAVGVVVLYTGLRLVQNQITNMATRQTYKAPGGLEATTEHAATVLSERLKELQQEKKDLLANARSARPRTPVFMHDGYAIRASAMYPSEIPVWVGSTPAELVGPVGGF